VEVDAMTVQLADPRQSRAAIALERRAMALWPRLDRAALRRCRQDPDKMAELIARRTALSPETIKQVLLMPSVSDEDISIWFG
jgi:hypothetical protein